MSLGHRPLDLLRGESAIEQRRDQLYPEDVGETEGIGLGGPEHSDAGQPLDPVSRYGRLLGEVVCGEFPGHPVILEGGGARQPRRTRR